jgi:hypothetical protein
MPAQNTLCETRPGVKSFAGHVYLPPGTADLGQGQDYPINSVSDTVQYLENVTAEFPRVLLVLRGPQRSKQCTSYYLAEWRSW